MKIGNPGARRALLALGLAVACGSVAAEVRFDPETGTGFVGKGDVQTPFAYNNKQMQARHAFVTFTYVEAQEQSQACYDHYRGDFTFTGYRTRKQGVAGSVVADSRQRNQYVGWNLTGFEGEPVEENTGWHPGTDNGCPGTSTPKGPMTVTSVKGLYANDLGASHLIWASSAD